MPCKTVNALCFQDEVPDSMMLTAALVQSVRFYNPNQGIRSL